MPAVTAPKIARAAKIRMITSMAYSVSSGVITSATVRSRSANITPASAVPIEIVLSGRMAPNTDNRQQIFDQIEEKCRKLLSLVPVS